MAINLDELAPNFRKAADLWPDAPTLASHYESLRGAYEAGDHGLIGVAKSFVECVAKTIVGEYSDDDLGNESTTELLTKALACLGLKNSKGASKMDTVLSAHNRLADALSDMRNNHDPNAHGKDGFLDALTANESKAFLLTADTITALLLNALDGHEPDIGRTREPYQRFAHFHRRIDGRNPFASAVEPTDAGPTLVLSVQTEPASMGEAVPLELRFELSRLLYHLDREAYLEVLEAASRLQPAVEEVDEDEVASAEEAVVAPPKEEPPVLVGSPEYQGSLTGLLADFEEVVSSLDLGVDDSKALASELIAAAEGALGLDWRTRPLIQAAMNVAMRRVLLRKSVDREIADKAASQLLRWLIANASGIAVTT